MKDIARLVAVAIVLAIVTPAALFGYRLTATWTANNTEQLLGGGIALCGGGFMLLAAFIGAGAFARLAGWRPPRPESPLPPPIDVTARALPPQIPPWGLTGGGQYELLPPPSQDRRYSMTVPKIKKDGEQGD